MGGRRVMLDDFFNAPLEDIVIEHVEATIVGKPYQMKWDVYRDPCPNMNSNQLLNGTINSLR